jgi:hypothetical protein
MICEKTLMQARDAANCSALSVGGACMTEVKYDMMFRMFLPRANWHVTWPLQKKCLEGAQVVGWVRKAYLLRLH